MEWWVRVVAEGSGTQAKDLLDVDVGTPWEGEHRVTLSREAVGTFVFTC